MSAPVEQARAYTDFSGFGSLRRAARENSPDALKQVAQQFEAMFVHQLLKGSRDSALAEDVLGGDRSDMVHDLYDQQMSLHLSQKGGLGITDMLVRQLGGQATPKAGAHPHRFDVTV